MNINQRVPGLAQRVGSFFQAIENAPRLAMVELVVVFGAVMIFLQRHATILDPDGYYHAKMALLISEHGIVKDFPWLPLTILETTFADQHFLYHVMLIPFVVFGYPLWGLKVSVVVFAVAAILVFFWTLRRLRCHGAFWWTALLASNAFVLFRLNLVKAYPISLILFCLGFVAFAEQRAWWLATILFVYVWTYGGWPLLLGTVMIGAMCNVIFSPHAWRRSGRLAIAAILGSVGGFVVNPYFPADIAFTKRQLIGIALTPSTTFGIGNEWAPVSLERLFLNQMPLMVVLVGVGIITLVWVCMRKRSWFQAPKLQGIQATAVVAAAILFVMSFFAQRYIEYAVPLVVLALALTVSAWREANLLKPITEIPKDFLAQTPSFARFLLSILFIMALAYGTRTIYEIDGQHANAPSINWGKGVGMWMNDHLPPDTLVMDIHWGDFPELFFWNSTQRYTMGLDPRLLDDAEGKKFKAWQGLYRALDSNPIQTITNEFSSRYVLVNTNMAAVLGMMNATGAPVLYRDRDVVLYDLRK